MQIQLSDHFSYSRLMRFTLPSVVMMVFTSVYSVVDGFFVSNFVGKTPFAAVNFVMPLLMMLGGLGFLFGTGGCALIARLLGEGKPERARKVFTLLTVTGILTGITVTVLALFFLRPACALLGAEGQLLEDCVTYGRILVCATTFYILQFEFQSFFIAAEKPQLGLAMTVAAGLTNMILDALLIAVFPLGLTGAALATSISQALAGIFPLIYFAKNRGGELYFVKPSPDLRALGQTCLNGSSELMSNISMSLVGMLYNVQLMKYAGENGVAAYGVLMYVNMIFLAVFIGYATGIAPVVSYHFGAQNLPELQSLLRKSILIIGISSAAMLIAGELLAWPLSWIFVSYDGELLEMTVHGFRIYSFSFLMAGFAIFGSSFFTALNNGPVSAAISFMRTLVFQAAAVMLFPLIWDLDGIWFSIVAAEVMAVVLTGVFLALNRKKYGYY